MIKICGVVLVLLGSYVYSETSDLWFAQSSLIGTFFCVSEALFSFALKARSHDLTNIGEVQNAQA